MISSFCEMKPCLVTKNYIFQSLFVNKICYCNTLIYAKTMFCLTVHHWCKPHPDCFIAFNMGRLIIVWRIFTGILQAIRFCPSLMVRQKPPPKKTKKTTQHTYAHSAGNATTYGAEALSPTSQNGRLPALWHCASVWENK